MEGGVVQNYYFLFLKEVLGSKYVKQACWLTWKNRLQREVQLTIVGRRGDIFLQHV